LRFRFLDDVESSDSVWSLLCFSKVDFDAFTGSLRRTVEGRCDTFGVGASSSPEEGMSKISMSWDCFVDAFANKLLLGNVDCILAGFWVFGADAAGVARGTTFAFAMGRGAMCFSPRSCPSIPGCGVFPRRPDVPAETSADLAGGGAVEACVVACDAFAVEGAADLAGSALRNDPGVFPDALPVFRAPPFAGSALGFSEGTRRFKRGFFVALAGYALNSSSEGTSNMSGLSVTARETPMRPRLLPPSSSFSDVFRGIVACLRGRSGDGGSLVDVGAAVGRDDLP
jgi:hypothetical protein